MEVCPYNNGVSINKAIAKEGPSALHTFEVRINQRI